MTLISNLSIGEAGFSPSCVKHKPCCRHNFNRLSSLPSWGKFFQHNLLLDAYQTSWSASTGYIYVMLHVCNTGRVSQISLFFWVSCRWVSTHPSKTIDTSMVAIHRRQSTMLLPSILHTIMQGIVMLLLKRKSQFRFQVVEAFSLLSSIISVCLEPVHFHLDIAALHTTSKVTFGINPPNMQKNVLTPYWAFMHWYLSSWALATIQNMISELEEAAWVSVGWHFGTLKVGF